MKLKFNLYHRKMMICGDGDDMVVVVVVVPRCPSTKWRLTSFLSISATNRSSACWQAYIRGVQPCGSGGTLAPTGGFLLGVGVAPPLFGFSFKFLTMLLLFNSDCFLSMPLAIFVFFSIIFGFFSIVTPSGILSHHLSSHLV